MHGATDFDLGALEKLAQAAGGTHFKKPKEHAEIVAKISSFLPSEILRVTLGYSSDGEVVYFVTLRSARDEAAKVPARYAKEAERRQPPGGA